MLKSKQQRIPTAPMWNVEKTSEIKEMKISSIELCHCTWTHYTHTYTHTHSLFLELIQSKSETDLKKVSQVFYVIGSLSIYDLPEGFEIKWKKSCKT